MKKLVYAFLFTDIERSTRRWEEQPEDMSADLRRHNGILIRAVEANDGRVFKMVGDAVYAVDMSNCKQSISAIGLKMETWISCYDVKLNGR